MYVNVGVGVGVCVVVDADDQMGCCCCYWFSCSAPRYALFLDMQIKHQLEDELDQIRMEQSRAQARSQHKEIHTHTHTPSPPPVRSSTPLTDALHSKFAYTVPGSQSTVSEDQYQGVDGQPEVSLDYEPGWYYGADPSQLDAYALEQEVATDDDIVGVRVWL
jgi:hypothetical protein